jgi:hypothetical protein
LLPVAFLLAIHRLLFFFELLGALLEFMVQQKPAGIPDCPAVTAMAMFDAADVSYVIPIESTAGAGRGVATERGAGVALNWDAGSGRRGGGAGSSPTR